MNALYAHALSGPFAKRSDESRQIISSFCGFDPAIWVEDCRVGEQGRVHVDEVAGHGYGCLDTVRIEPGME